jgi:molybdopterin-biosynthesis enzyme MoeA-like protein
MSGRNPRGADLILNKVPESLASESNVIVMAGAPSIMQGMLDEVKIANANPEVGVGSYPFFDPQHGL